MATLHHIEETKCNTHQLIWIVENGYRVVYDALKGTLIVCDILNFIIMSFNDVRIYEHKNSDGSLTPTSQIDIELSDYGYVIMRLIED